ncbi:vesicle transport protein GOT1A [Puntigrus tetrazona]|uniref:vesicle transport protein GOT1A n=1 Tax=Puntigrus tetrazona TaxID=1606681 RepID=UPI001C89DDE7|nr:vesicle transport protein GOT1A [Puntigrus tetrazona]
MFTLLRGSKVKRLCEPHTPVKNRGTKTGRSELKEERAKTMITITEFQKIGVGLSGFGVFFVLFGILLYFDSVLLAFGNILFLSGLAFIIGLRRTAHFFFQRQKLRSSAFFLGGVALVLLRWPRIGMLVETYGFVLLFKSFFPMAFGFLATALNIPFLTTILNKLSGSSSSMV